MTKYGISELSIIPVRKEPSEKSEMVTQLLFGETFQIIEETGSWSFIKIEYDNYEGWVSTNSIQFISEETFNQIVNGNSYITNNLFNTIINKKNNENTIIPLGSTLPNFNLPEKSFQIGDNQYKLITTETISKNYNIVSLTKLLLNSPYLWGGKNPFGIDCSGFVQVPYKVLGVSMPRDAHQQVKLGNTINFISDSIPGDLAFFDDSEGNIIHVGIIISSNEIIHASGKVRIDSFDQQGIFNKDLHNYTHKLRVIKRIF